MLSVPPVFGQLGIEVAGYVLVQFGVTPETTTFVPLGRYPLGHVNVAGEVCTAVESKWQFRSVNDWIPPSGQGVLATAWAGAITPSKPDNKITRITIKETFDLNEGDSEWLGEPTRSLIGRLFSF